VHTIFDGISEIDSIAMNSWVRGRHQSKSMGRIPRYRSVILLHPARRRHRFPVRCTRPRLDSARSQPLQRLRLYAAIAGTSHAGVGASFATRLDRVTDETASAALPAVELTACIHVAIEDEISSFVVKEGVSNQGVKPQIDV
jgi:hypothetical protein